MILSPDGTRYIAAPIQPTQSQAYTPVAGNPRGPRVEMGGAFSIQESNMVSRPNIRIFP